MFFQSYSVKQKKKINSNNPVYGSCSGSSWNLVIKCSNIDILHSHFEISQVDIIESAPHS